jgi:hypothetical protein
MRRWIIIALLATATVNGAEIFNFRVYGTVAPTNGWTFVAGHFDGDALADVVGYHPSDGSLWMGHNTNASFVFDQWATVSPTNGWTVRSGDFDGDTLDDLLLYHPSDGSVWVGRNTGGGFVINNWATLSPHAGWSIEVGDFAGTSRPDVLAYYPGDGSVYVGTNRGSSFGFGLWATVQPAAGWSFQTGEFTHEGRQDIAGYFPGDGSVWVGRNTGSGFNFGSTPWYTFQPASGWTIVAGKFSGDETHDLGAYLPAQGEFWVGRSTGNAFLFAEKWASLSPSNGWSFVPGDFTPSAQQDLLAYFPGKGELEVGDNVGLPPEGYAWPLSAAPGETITIYASGRMQPTAEILRHVRSGDVIVGVSIGSVSFVSSVHTNLPMPWRNGAGWPPTFDVHIPMTGWPSGIYSVRLRSLLTAEEFHVTFIVKSRFNCSGIAMLSNINTWNAYNRWGGKSKYDGAALTSFMRPNPGASPVGLWTTNNVNDHTARGEVFLLSWLEENGYHVDLFTDIDFHNGIPPGYRKLILSTHPEYWTDGMYDRLESFLNQGGSLIYLAGNGLFERGTYTNVQQQMIFRNGVEADDHDLDLRGFSSFRYLGRHERSVLGVATSNCDNHPPFRGYEVVLPDHFLFRGLGVQRGQLFGTAGVGASGDEIDTMCDSFANGLPCQITIPPGGIPPSSLPSGIVLLARAPNQGTNCVEGVGADMTFYRHPGGGFVFSAGSIAFGHSLSQDLQTEVLPGLVRNVLGSPSQGILVPRAISSKGFEFTLIGCLPAQFYVLERSPNLRDWQPLSTNEFLGVPIELVDSGATNAPTRFYRARLVD